MNGIAKRGCPRVWLLTGTPPGCRSVGAIFLRDMIATYPRDSLACTVVRPTTDTEPSLGCLPWLRKKVLRYEPVRFRGRLGSIRARLTRRAAWRRLLGSSLNDLTRGVTAHAKDERAEVVVALLNQPLMLAVAARAADHLGIPVVPIMMDPPEYLIDRVGADRAVRTYLLACLDNVVRRAPRVGVASYAMAHYVSAQYGTDAVVLIHGFDRSQWRSVRPSPRSHTNCVIGFAGSLYATDAFDALRVALDSVGWRVGGRAVTLRLVGSVAVPAATPCSHYDIVGWTTPQDAIALIAEADIGYLPYWFDERYRQVSALSFPNKMSVYVAAGTPVFFHGPEWSGPGAFVKQHGLGVFCSSRQPEEIIRDLTEALSPAAIARHLAAAERVRETELGLHVFQRRFAELLGIDATFVEGPAPHPICSCGWSGQVPEVGAQSGAARIGDGGALRCVP